MSGRVEDPAGKERTRFAGLLEPDLANLRLREQGGSFDQAAEFLLAHVTMLTFTCEQVFHRLVLDLQPLEMNDPQVIRALPPNLILRQLHPALRPSGISAIRALTSFRTSVARKGLLAGKRIVPLVVS